MSQCIVFLGSSLAQSDPARLASLTWRPPARQGDVLRAVNDGASIIGIIDGSFEGVPAVLHKEVMFALASGVHVFGAASMGALRAAELHVFGMIGVGAIYDWYRSGKLDADDEVAVIHAPATMGYAPLSLPLVNVRATLDFVIGSSDLDTATGNAVLAAAQSLHFKVRTWRRIVETLGNLGHTLPDASWFSKRTVDQKAIDARAMIDAVLSLAAKWPGPFRAEFDFEATDAWDDLISTHDQSPITAYDELVLDEARLLGAEFEALLSASRAITAARNGRALPMALAPLSEVDRFRREHNLLEVGRYHQWLASARLDASQLRAALSDRLAVKTLTDVAYRELSAAMLAEIKLRGLYPTLADRARRKVAYLETNPKLSGSLSVGEWEMLLSWFTKRDDTYADGNGTQRLRDKLAFRNVAEMKRCIRHEFLFSGQAS